MVRLMLGQRSSCTTVEQFPVDLILPEAKPVQQLQRTLSTLQDCGSTAHTA